MINHIAENLRDLRRRHRMTLEEVAERLEVTRQAVSRWEGGESVPDLDNCAALARLFQVSLDDLVHFDPQAVGVQVPPKGKHMFGLVTVGDRGQIVIPKQARALFNIKPGDALLVLGDEALETRGLALVDPGPGPGGPGPVHGPCEGGTAGPAGEGGPPAVRRIWMDQLRWQCILWVVVFHVVSLFNSCGMPLVVGAGWPALDILGYFTYPWLMPLMFLLSGLGARYALERRTARAFLRERRDSLLLPRRGALVLVAPLLCAVAWRTAGVSFQEMAGVLPVPLVCLIALLAGLGQAPILPHLFPCPLALPPPPR